MIANGASELARRNVGTPVFGGMILASFLGIFAIPPLYVMFQWMREKLRPSVRPRNEREAELVSGTAIGHTKTQVSNAAE